MIFIKVDTVNETVLRAAIRFACENNGTAPDECYEVIGRKILNGQSTAICGSWHDAFVAFYHGATSIMAGSCASPANEVTNTERAPVNSRGERV